MIKGGLTPWFLCIYLCLSTTNKPNHTKQNQTNDQKRAIAMLTMISIDTHRIAGVGKGNQFSTVGISLGIN
jgi:hypothetical protein